MKVHKITSKTGNCGMSLSLFQVVVMIRLTSSSSHEANATLTWCWKCLSRAREVKMQALFLVMEVDEDGVTVG